MLYLPNSNSLPTKFINIETFRVKSQRCELECDLSYPLKGKIKQNVPNKIIIYLIITNFGLIKSYVIKK